MFDPFAWLRQRVKIAFLHGIQDAVEELQDVDNNESTAVNLEGRVNALVGKAEATDEPAQPKVRRKGS